MSNRLDSKHQSWQRRNPDKAVLRDEVWSLLERDHISAPEHIWGSIPDFEGADRAAERLAQLPFWRDARVIKSNPDRPQIPVRLRALQDGKLLYTPVPELSSEFPFLLLDPAQLRARGIPFEDAAPISGALQHGRKVRFEEMLPMDVMVVGCVAVTKSGARTGKGGGFADLELGIFRELNLIRPDTPIVTTVHGHQVVNDDRIVMLGHDWALDWIVTPDETIETRSRFSRPTGVDWPSVQLDQYRDIPFLQRLRDELGE